MRIFLLFRVIVFEKMERRFHNSTLLFVFNCEKCFLYIYKYFCATLIRFLLVSEWFSLHKINFLYKFIFCFSLLHILCNKTLYNTDYYITRERTVITLICSVYRFLVLFSMNNNKQITIKFQSTKPRKHWNRLWKDADLSFFEKSQKTYKSFDVFARDRFPSNWKFSTF